MAALFVLVGLVALGAASALGLTADSRDQSYGIGRIFSHRQADQTKNR